MLNTDDRYMSRCIELARRGLGHVAPNPMVGAVLVHGDRIIGEGFHAKYGEAHAEVNCINSIEGDDRSLISQSTLFVSLEPCVHHGKTPPCTDLIIRENIPSIVIGCRDPFEKVNGKGIEKLIAAGKRVKPGVMEEACRALNKRFFTFHLKHRPYIILKWAQTADGIMGSNAGAPRLMITNAETNRLVHRWRSEEAAILVGTNTALQDDPSLDNRFWQGRSPVRLVLDSSRRLPSSLKLFNRAQQTVVFNNLEAGDENNLKYFKLNSDQPAIAQVLRACYEMQLQSIIVEGGAKLLTGFIEAGLWDEARVITNQSMHAAIGVKAPFLQGAQLTATETIGSDTIHCYLNQQ